jgi:hypothetical protein
MSEITKELEQMAVDARARKGLVICGGCDSEWHPEDCQYDSGYLCPACEEWLSNRYDIKGYTVKELADLAHLLDLTELNYRRAKVAKVTTHTAKLAGVV